MVQIENEYGSYDCDVEYRLHLKSLFTKLLGSNMLLYTTDGCTESEIRCGRISNTFVTVDFGVQSEPRHCFRIQDSFQDVKSPHMNSEFYPGWIDHWGYPHNKIDGLTVSKRLDTMLADGASVNVYPIYGGTMFGFESGSNLGSNGFQPSITSYDFDAPISEAGDLTPKYFQIKTIISKYLPVGPDLNSTVPKGHYGFVYLRPIGSLFDYFDYSVEFETPLITTTTYPKTFEYYGLGYGFMKYSAKITDSYPSPATLRVTTNDGVRDRAYVFVDTRLQGILSRMFGGISTLPIRIRSGQTLTIIVENQGRVDFGPGLKKDFKGLFSNVTIQDRIITNWTMIGSNLETIPDFVEDVERIYGSKKFRHRIGDVKLRKEMSIWKGTFHCPSTPKDTFLKLSNWNKGVAFINGFHLGRYWPRMGPQVTLYIPGPLLKRGKTNVLILMEQDDPPKHKRDTYVELTDVPIIDGPTPDY